MTSHSSIEQGSDEERMKVSLLVYSYIDGFSSHLDMQLLDRAYELGCRNWDWFVSRIDFFRTLLQLKRFSVLIYTAIGKRLSAAGLPAILKSVRTSSSPRNSDSSRISLPFALSRLTRKSALRRALRALG